MGIRDVLADHSGLGAAYWMCATETLAGGATPDPPEFWIATVACAELTKVQDALAKVLDLAEGAAAKRQHAEADTSKAP